MARERTEFFISIAIILGVFLRLQGIFGDLWLDEIWSLQIADSLRHPLAVIAYPIDNNHPLNTLWMYLLGTQAPGWLYRLPAFLCGLLLLVAIARSDDTQDRNERALRLLLVSASFLMVLYATEARGYATMLLLMFISFTSAQRLVVNMNAANLLLFQLTVPFGVLAHPSFLVYYCALLIWSTTSLLKHKPTRALLDFLLMHGLPVILLSWFYFSFLEPMPEGRGPLASYLQIVIDAACVAAGGPELSAYAPEKGLLVFTLAFGVCLLLLGEIVNLWRSRSSLWIFYLLAVFILPLTILLVTQPNVIFVRYFLPSIFFGYLLFARFLSRSFQNAGQRRLLAFALLGIFLLLNGMRLTRFSIYGRGDFQATLRYLSEHTAGDTVTLRSDHDARTLEMLNFYWQNVGAGKKLAYTPALQNPTPPSQWLLIHSQDLDLAPSQTRQVFPHVYQLEKEFPFAGQSGWSWYVYRLKPA